MSDGGLRVRPAGAADLADVVRIERAAAEAPHWTAEVYAAMVMGEAEAAVQRCLIVAEMDGVVGFAAAKVLRLGQSAVAELESVAVAEEMRRQGVGRALCAAAMAWCREQGAGVVELEVRASSGVASGAIALYTALGFIETGQRRMYYRHPIEDALLMALKLR
jgi:ribosomal-protein-alanine N-acetyltransferase